MKKLLAVLIACLALPLAACGDDDDDGGGGSSAPAPAEQQDTSAAKPKPKPTAETVTVDMKDIKFLPKDVTVKAGTTVKWTNSDKVPHTVTKTGGPGEQFDSGNVDPGGEFEQMLDAPGKIDYVCTIHPGQEGSITVKG